MSCPLCAPTIRAAKRGHLCEPHFHRLDADLADIETQAALLDPRPTTPTPGARPGGLPSHRAPARLDVIALTDHRSHGDTPSIYGTLHGWATAVRLNRALNAPNHPTIASERRTLTAHLEWIAGQPWITEFARDLRDLLGHLRTANGTRPDPPAGRCYLPTTTDGDICGGPIWVDTANGVARCGRCRAHWDGHLLARLTYELERDVPTTDDGRPMVTAHQLAARLGVTVNAVRIRLHRNGIRATRGHYHPDALEAISA